jgi:hypothetical protein
LEKGWEEEPLLDSESSQNMRKSLMKHEEEERYPFFRLPQNLWKIIERGWEEQPFPNSSQNMRKTIVEKG